MEKDIGRKIKKFLKLPYILFLRIMGMKISFTSSLALDSEIKKHKDITIGKHCNFDRRTSIRCYNYNGKSSKIVIGDNFSGGTDLKIVCGGEIVIGNNVSCAGNVFITSENHGLNPLTPNFNDNELECTITKIGNGVWLGEQAIILAGVEIGEKSIIGAGSVVTKDIPPYSIAVGNPARVIKTWDFENNKYIKF